jgi:hypothetical protein
LTKPPSEMGSKRAWPQHKEKAFQGQLHNSNWAPSNSGSSSVNRGGKLAGALV